MFGCRINYILTIIVSIDNNIFTLGYNLIGDEGVKALSEALKINNKLITLNLCTY